MVSSLLKLVTTCACLLLTVRAQTTNLRQLQTSSIADIAVANGDLFSTLVTALDAAGLVSFLSCKTHCQQVTVFAPTNNAFASLNSATSGLVTELASNPEYKTHLRYILFYHLVYGVVRSNQITDGGHVQTTLGTPVTTFTNPIRVNEAQVVQPFDVVATNGIVHTIDQVLLPSFITKTTPQVASEAGIFSTLLAAAEAAGIVDVLSSTRGYTLLAPTDAAFGKLGDATIAALLADPVQLGAILQYHVIPNAIVFSSELSPGAVTTLEGSQLQINESISNRWSFTWSNWGRWIQTSTFTFNDNVGLVQKDILSQNGIIHAIDSVLIPPTSSSPGHTGATIADIVVGNDNFSTLLTALSTAGLVGLFDEASDGPFTVLAPTNAAFASFGDATIQSLLNDPAQLADILRYHVISGSVLSSSLTDGRVPTALPNQEVGVDVRPSTILLNGSTRVIDADIMASNGVVHVIDRVLIPPGNIVQTAQGVDRFSTLVDLVVLADLAGALSAESTDLTVFAPTNAAFAKLPASLVATLTDPTNKGLLQDVLKYHVVASYVPFRSVTRGSVTTLQGEAIHVGYQYGWGWQSMSGVVLNGNSNIVQRDVFTSNGVIHAIDEVLIPPSIAAGL